MNRILRTAGRLGLVSVLTVCIPTLELHAANRTWTGGGADANWATANNWGGTAPTNSDNAIFNGTIQPANVNNIANLSLGWIAFNNGGFSLSGNLLTLNGTAVQFTNTAGINIISLPIVISAANSQAWYVASGSELRIAGPFTNSSSGNPLGLILGGGTVHILSPSFESSRMLTTFNGILMNDGATMIITNDGFRLSPTNASQTAMAVITNNGFIQIGGNSSLRMGQTQSSLNVGAATVNISSGELLLQPAGDNGAPSYGGCITLGENPGVTAT